MAIDNEEGHQLLTVQHSNDGNHVPYTDEEEEAGLTEMYYSKPQKQRASWKDDTLDYLRLHGRPMSLVLAACIALGAFYVLAHSVSLPRVLSSLGHRPSSEGESDSSEQPSEVLGSEVSPFTGPFARIPVMSALPKRQRRMTIVGAWNDDTAPAYLHQYFYSIQKNADTLDLLFLNRKLTNESECLDFEKHNLNITWGGNIKVVCIDNEEWQRRHVDYLCGSKYGWNCNATEYQEVTTEFKSFDDTPNYYWRPFRGFAFRDLIADPDVPFWAWMDHDLFLGDFRRYPLNVLSQLSILTGNSFTTSNLMMAGQLTAFNFDDPELGSAWKRIPAMQTAAHFTHHAEGRMFRSAEERFWSYAYLRSRGGLPGEKLSFGLLSDIYGDDWNDEDGQKMFVVSGREVLLVDTIYSREDIETLLAIERSTPIDDFGNIGWTTNASSIIEETVVLDCNQTQRNFRQCVTPPSLTASKPSVLRASYIHFEDQKAGNIWRRLELDHRHRGYERKLFRHHLKSKKLDWFELPPFAIEDHMVLRYNSKSIEVFAMGKDRETTIYYREKGKKSIG